MPVTGRLDREPLRSRWQRSTIAGDHGNALGRHFVMERIEIVHFSRHFHGIAVTFFFEKIQHIPGRRRLNQLHPNATGLNKRALHITKVIRAPVKAKFGGMALEPHDVGIEFRRLRQVFDKNAHTINARAVRPGFFVRPPLVANV